MSKRVFVCAAGLALAAVLSACGGGGGAASSAATVSGTAATGAAIASGTVTLKCVSGTTTAATTGTDGSFNIDVSSVTLPCAGRVDYKDSTGTPQKLHTFITAAGTANITPITELLVANLTGGTPADAFDSFDATKAKGYTAAAVKAAADAVKSYLKNTLGVDTSKLPDDPVGTKFVPAVGGTGGDDFDKVLDDLAAKLKTKGKKLSDAVGDIKSGSSGGGSTSGGPNITTPGTPACYPGFSITTVQQFVADMGASSAPVAVNGDIGLFASFGSPPVDPNQTLTINTDGSVTVNGSTVRYALICKGPASTDPFFSYKLSYVNFISTTSFGGTGDGGQFYIKNDNSVMVNDYPTDGAQVFVFRSPPRFAGLTKASASGTVNVTGSASYTVSLSDSYVQTKTVVIDGNPPAKTSTNLELYLYGSGGSGAILLTFDTTTVGGPYLLDYSTGAWFKDGSGAINGSDGFLTDGCSTPSNYGFPTCKTSAVGVTLNTVARTVTFTNTKIGGTTFSTRTAILNGSISY